MATQGFKKAERYLTNPTLALTGPTGSGKTMSALRCAAGIAKALGKRFAVVDTENGSASLYSHLFDFDTLNITPPFTTEKYIEAINLAEQLDYSALVIDSITHAWAGEGGLLEQKAQLDARPGTNHWTNWNPIKAKDQRFKNAYLHSSIPFLIATMRSKMEYAQTEDGGKKKIQKMGMAPVQSDGIEYDFSVVFDVAMNHEAEVSKDRTGLFAKNPIFQISEAVGEALVKWRGEGKELPPAPTLTPAVPITVADYDGVPEEVMPKEFIEARRKREEAQAEAEKIILDGVIKNAFDKANSPPMPASGPDLDEALEGKEEAGEYVISFGKYSGRALHSIKGTELVNYIAWLEKTAKDQNKPIQGKVAEMINHAKLLLSSQL